MVYITLCMYLHKYFYVAPNYALMSPEVATTPPWRTTLFSTPHYRDRLVVAVDEAHCIHEWLEGYMASYFDFNVCHLPNFVLYSYHYHTHKPPPPSLSHSISHSLYPSFSHIHVSRTVFTDRAISLIYS